MHWTLLIIGVSFALIPKIGGTGIVPCTAQATCFENATGAWHFPLLFAPISQQFWNFSMQQASTAWKVKTSQQILVKISKSLFSHFFNGLSKLSFVLGCCFKCSRSQVCVSCVWRWLCWDLLAKSQQRFSSLFGMKFQTKWTNYVPVEYQQTEFLPWTCGTQSFWSFQTCPNIHSQPHFKLHSISTKLVKSSRSHIPLSSGDQSTSSESQNSERIDNPRANPNHNTVNLTPRKEMLPGPRCRRLQSFSHAGRRDTPLYGSRGWIETWRWCGGWWVWQGFELLCCVQDALGQGLSRWSAGLYLREVQSSQLLPETLESFTCVHF